MPAPDKVHELVERFDYNLDSYRAGDYKEARVRSEFIDPMFKELGWDINNEQGYAEAYKDVVHEDALKIGVATKAPDYSFRIGGVRKFFLEAKKPAVNIKGGIEPAYQLRRYAWSAKLPLSLLTDFEELAVYDCRVQPNKDDKSSVARTMYLTYKDYLDNWDDIAAIFSREAILKGAFDKYAEANKKRRGTAEVDDAFLEEIEAWRRLLARDIAINNHELSQRELNAAVQATIDRIIFLRITEDRGIEPYGALQDLLKGENVYRRLGVLFQNADDRYNSGLFHFNEERNRVGEPDTFTLQLTIDDKPLKDIIKSIYYPDSPYEFSVLPADILGQVYERFLGKVIRLDSDHQAIIEEKPEVKKAGGVYYTPTYIVDYIVENTVGKLAEGKTLDELSAANETPPLRVLDPACGSGTFLLGAYQYLLDWHLQWYVDNNPKKHAKGKRPSIYQDQQGAWRLSTDERKRILLTHIYGVDIDAQAVEVTKLSLLLKVLEGENSESLNQQSQLFQERVLPDLSENIKCGNSLIAPDFYQNVQPHLIGEEERYRINVFDWESEFADVFEAGGFDAVIGNPPYGGLVTKTEERYYQAHYNHQDSYKDLYLLFLERYQHLLKPSHPLGVIVSNTWLQSVTFTSIREHLTQAYMWERILEIPGHIFKAVVDTHVLIFRKEQYTPTRDATFTVDILRDENDPVHKHDFPISGLPRDGATINITLSFDVQAIYRKMLEQSDLVSDICNVFNGVKPFEKGKGKPPQTRQVVTDKPYVLKGTPPDDSWTPLLRGGLIQRYRNLWNHDYWIQYGEWLAAPRNPAIFKAPHKIVTRQTGDSLISTIVDGSYIQRNNMHIVIPKQSKPSIFYLLGLLNSKLLDFAYMNINPEKGEVLAEIKKRHVELLPIKTIDFNNPKDVEHHDEIANLAGDMLSYHEQLASAKTSQDKKMYTRLIAQTDKQIDQKVYELYGLDDDEIAVVEGALA